MQALHEPGKKAFMREALAFIREAEVQNLLAGEGLSQVACRINHIKSQGDVREAAYVKP
ncbi:MAG: hypothetical protein ACM30E_12585 [Nitrososphaerales archaeon]